MIEVSPSATLEFITPNAIQLIERAARTCYLSDPSDEPSDEFVKRVSLQKGHESVIEHASATFRVICDRGVTHEIVRHRIGVAYSQESTRFCNYSKDKHDKQIRVIRPPGLGGIAAQAWKVSMEIAEKAYLDMLEAGCSPQIARSVLPNSLKTEIVITMDFRAWRHFLKLRTAKAAHPQMREIASQIGYILAKECPALFGEYAEGAGNVSL